MNPENMYQGQRATVGDPYDVLASLAAEGTAVPTGCFRKARNGVYQTMFVHRDYAESAEYFEPLRRLLVEIPGGHIVVASADSVVEARDVQEDSEIAGTWFEFTKGRFSGTVGRFIGIAHEAELSPWVPKEGSSESGSSPTA